MDERYRILIVCHGNTCRSPMAAAVIDQGLRAAGLAGRVSVASAGVAPRETGSPSDPRAVAAVAPLGLDISAHRSAPATCELLAAHDEVLAVDRATLEVVRARLGGGERPRTGLLGAQAADADIGDIADPYHGTAADYARALDEIVRACAGLVAALPARLAGRG